MLELPLPILNRFCTLEVEVGPVRILGGGRFGERRVIPIIGGRVSGARISGVIQAGGADWQTVSAAGMVEMNARYTFETGDGAIIEIKNYGFRHGPANIMRRLAAGETVPAQSYYMRSTATLETGHPDYAWVNGMMFVGTGARNAALVQIDLYSVA